MEEGFFARRLFLPDARGPHRYMRVTWHRETSTIVFSHWQDDVCVASTPIALQDASQLIGLIVESLREATLRPARAASPASPVRARDLLQRLRERFSPQLAQIVALHERLRQDHSSEESSGI